MAAVNYHFGDRDGLLLVLVTEHAQGRQYLRLINQLANHPVHADEVKVAFAEELLRTVETQLRA